MFKISFIEQILPKLRMMYHVAHKKVPYYDQKTMQSIKPTANNGIKLEAFIFDAFELSEKSVILEAVRSEEFSPMKNAEGSDSPISALQALKEEFKRISGSEKEISPRDFYFGEEILRSKEMPKQ